MKAVGLILMLALGSSAWAVPKCDEIDANYRARTMVYQFADEQDVRCWDYEMPVEGEFDQIFFVTKVICREYRTNKPVSINGQTTYFLKIDAQTCRPLELMERR